MSTIASLHSLANEIASGFNALLERLDEQKKVEADLREQLSRASDRVRTDLFTLFIYSLRMLQTLALDLSSLTALKDLLCV